MSEAHEVRKSVIAARGWTDSLIRKHLTEYLGVEHRYGYEDCEYFFYDPDEVAAKEIVPEIAAALQRNLDKRASRRASALKGVATRKSKMEMWAETVELTIERGGTDEQLKDLSFRTHGGN